MKGQISEEKERKKEEKKVTDPWSEVYLLEQEDISLNIFF